MGWKDALFVMVLSGVLWSWFIVFKILDFPTG